MKALGVTKNNTVNVVNIMKLPKASRIKLCVCAEFFTKIPDYKAVLEKHLPAYPCVKVSETITICHQEQTFKLDVVHTEPQGVVSLVEIECEVDFEEREVIKVDNSDSDGDDVAVGTHAQDHTVQTPAKKRKLQESQPQLPVSPPLCMASSTKESPFTPFTGKSYTLLD